MLEAVLLRTVGDREFSARRSPFVRSLAKGAVGLGLHRLVKWIPPFLQPVMDCSMKTPMTEVSFNKPFLTGRELEYIRQAHENMHLSGDGPFTKRCQAWLERKIGCPKALLTHSGTGALEMAAILAGTGPGDEIIMPSFTFVSTANAFVLRGGVPVFVDVREDTLNIDESKIEAAITARTKAIVVVHYAGIACEMDAIREIARRRGLLLIEDAAQALGSAYRGRPLGSFGELAAISFHETKNLISGEGGALLLNSRRPDRARRNHPREGHQPQQVLSRRRGQVHLGGHRLVVPAQRHPRGVPLGAARGRRDHRGGSQGAMGALSRGLRRGGASRTGDGGRWCRARRHPTPTPIS